MNDQEMDLVETQQTAPAMVEAESSKAIEQVRAALVIGKKFPRDTTASLTRILTECRRYELAEEAMYRYPRGGEMVVGPSIRLAEVLARNWGNIKTGFDEIETSVEQTLVKVWAWDVETNFMDERTFTIKHEIGKKNGQVKRLTDERDIREKVANIAQRGKRACILAVLPGDIVSAAEKQVQETLRKGKGNMTMEDRIRMMVVAFKDIGITQEMLEAKLGHKVDIITADEIVDLTAAYKSIKDGVAKRGDFFDFSEPILNDEKASALTDKLNKRKGGKGEKETQRAEGDSDNSNGRGEA